MGVPIPRDEFADADYASYRDEAEAYVAQFRLAFGPKSSRSNDSGARGDLTQFLYSDLPVNGKCGTDLFHRIQMYGNNWYYISEAEAKALDSHREYFAQLFHDRPTAIDFGCGNDLGIMRTTLPTAKMVNAVSVFLIDKNASYASNGADQVRKSIKNIEVTAVNADFTRPIPLNIQGSKLATSFGCGATQFALEGTADPSRTTFEEYLQAVGKTTNYEATFVASIDTATNGDAVDCYGGQYMSAFQRQIWATGKKLVEIAGGRVTIDGLTTPNAAEAVHYVPTWAQGRVNHKSIMIRTFSWHLPGDLRPIILKPGHPRDLAIGYSDKNPDIELIRRRAPNVGHDLVNVLSGGRSSLKFLVFVGKDASADQRERAAKTHFPAPLLAGGSLDALPYRGKMIRGRRPPAPQQVRL